MSSIWRSTSSAWPWRSVALDIPPALCNFALNYPLSTFRTGFRCPIFPLGADELDKAAIVQVSRIGIG